ncbi:hypothetical protein [Cellulomonas sp. P24]|uniref:hypothetical protein n=1 Tax=Cellulomonas sp. P24 TaxID=2885206 RepID=UPI00216B054C|nr:hypothetical protein [Cellulomonas sp. P24]MCR6491636.1 hypothetical protein [Cellulomonas sp. P24]
MSALTCPMCGSEIDASGPGVASHHPDYDPLRGWASSWVPFVEDLRGSPPRLVHAACFANEQGIDALIELFHTRDLAVRQTEHERWRKDRGIA